MLLALGRQLNLEDRYVDAEQALRQALTVAEMTDAHGVSAGALATIGSVLSSLSRFDDAIAAADEAVEIVEAHGTAEDTMLVYVNATATYLLAGRYDDAARLAVAGVEHAQTVRDARRRRRAAGRDRRRRAVPARPMGRGPGDDRRQPQHR